VSAASRRRRRLARAAQLAAEQAAQWAAQQAAAALAAAAADEESRRANEHRRAAWSTHVPFTPAPMVRVPEPVAGDADSYRRAAELLRWLALGHDRLLQLGKDALARTHRVVVDRMRGHGAGARDECLVCGESWNADPSTCMAHVNEHAEEWLAERRYIVPGRYPEREQLGDALCVAFAVFSAVR